jgi:glycosyltransferase involved in cell wall biosynthesis
MKVAILMLPRFFGGGEIRTLKVLSFFPKENYVLIIPKNKKLMLMRDIKKYLNDRESLDIVKSAYELEDFHSIGHINEIAYGRYIAKVCKRLNADLLYAPYDYSVLSLGIRSSGMKWSLLLQSIPAIGSLTIEDGYGFSLFLKNAKLNNLGLLKALNGYTNLNLLSLAAHGVQLLSVSKSIPYEMKKVGINLNFKVVDPGIGVEKCNYLNQERVYDLIFHARITPEKGIFDFLKIVKGVANYNKQIKALVVGAASSEMAKEVIKYAEDLRIAKNVEFKFNMKSNYFLNLLASSKLFIYPSRSDAFPLVVLESLSCGTPVLAYGIPAIRFNYSDAKAVIKVKPLDIKGMIDHAIKIIDGSEKVVNDGIKFSEKYTWENVAKAEWKLIESIAS